jgi:hypothetical protein
MSGKASLLKKIEGTLVTLATIFFLFIAAGYFLPSQVRIEGSWPLPCLPDTAYKRLHAPEKLALVLPLFSDTGVYRTLPYGNFGYGGVAWYRKPDGLLKAYAEFLRARPDSGVFLGLNFREEGKALLLLTPRQGEAGPELAWRFEARFGANPIGRYFGLELKRLVEQNLAKPLPSYASALCYGE